MNYYQQFKNLSKRFKELHEQFLDYKAEAEELEAENEALKVKIDVLNAENEALRGRIDTLNKNIDKGLYEIEKNLEILNSLMGEIKDLKGFFSENPDDEFAKLDLYEKDSERLRLIECIGRMGKSIGKTLIRDWNDRGKYKLVR